jgi:uncharacterized small protein (DUF1192 family)
MTRFTHWDRPHAYPFFDLVNRDTGEGGCFDLSVLLEDFTGSVFLRDEHVIEMARSLGMATQLEVAELKAQIALLQSQINKLPDAQEELRSGLDSLVSKFHRDLLADSFEPPVGNKESDADDQFLQEAEREAVRPFSL